MDDADCDKTELSLRKKISPYNSIGLFYLSHLGKFGFLAKNTEFHNLLRGKNFTPHKALSASCNIFCKLVMLPDFPQFPHEMLVCKIST